MYLYSLFRIVIRHHSNASEQCVSDVLFTMFALSGLKAVLVSITQVCFSPCYFHRIKLG